MDNLVTPLAQCLREQHWDCSDEERDEQIGALMEWYERHPDFSRGGTPEDLQGDFACGWCERTVGSPDGQIFIDPEGTAWHYLCAMEAQCSTP